MLIYRTKTGRWKGPFTFISVDEKTAVIQFPPGCKNFRSVCVWPDFLTSHAHYPSARESANGEIACKDQSDDVHDTLAMEEGEDLVMMLRKVNVKAGAEEEQMFDQPSRAELEGLLNNATFRPVAKDDVPVGARIFGARFVDEIKWVGELLRKKSRLVSHN